jgi:hypothetical protein
MAAQAEAIKRLKERVEGHSGPVLSVYLSVNARHPENQGQAYKIRLKDALREIEELPEDLASQVRESVEGGTPHARTLVFFAAPDGFFERYDLQVDLQEAVRFGEPYVAPLVLAVDEHEPYGVAMVEAEEFRFFVSEPVINPNEGRGAAPESGFFREVDMQPHGMYPVSGGSTDMDPAGRTQQANIRRFFKETGELTRKVVFQDNVRHLIVVGPKERTVVFLEELPQEVRDRVVAEEAVATNAPESEIMQQFEAIQQQAEREREDDLIAKVRENGVRGVKDTIEALQEGRVYHLVALYDLEGETRWCDNDELAITDMTQKECPFCRQETRVRPIMDVLIDLATNRGARLEYVRSRDDFGQTPNEDIEREHNREDASAVLHEEFEGLAGLLRY